MVAMNYHLQQDIRLANFEPTDCAVVFLRPVPQLTADDFKSLAQKLGPLDRDENTAFSPYIEIWPVSRFR